MHPTATRNEFLRLRVLGLSFASIARRLGVSKPTLIAWSRKAKPDLAARIAEDHQHTLKAIDDEVAQQRADLTRRHNFLKQELLSRAFRDIPTPHIETLAGEYQQQIENLKSSADFQSAVSPISNRQPSDVQPPPPTTPGLPDASHSNAPSAPAAPPSPEPIRT
ncbi:MAG TPA: transposase [Candidatus Binatia bacterium]|jgi:hypothetical protein|nr:transposase [Candidatus Binatia bacterium]